MQCVEYHRRFASFRLHHSKVLSKCCFKDILKLGWSENKLTPSSGVKRTSFCIEQIDLRISGIILYSLERGYQVYSVCSEASCTIQNPALFSYDQFSVPICSNYLRASPKARYLAEKVQHADWLPYFYFLLPWSKTKLHCIRSAR